MCRTDSGGGATGSKSYKPRYFLQDVVQLNPPVAGLHLELSGLHVTHADTTFRG